MRKPTNIINTNVDHRLRDGNIVERRRFSPLSTCTTNPQQIEVTEFGLKPRYFILFHFIYYISYYLYSIFDAIISSEIKILNYIHCYY